MVLVDSSVWVEYFKGNERTLVLNKLLDTITKIPLEINWNAIVCMQTQNLKNGINKVGIADLIVAQNVMYNNLTFPLSRKLLSKSSFRNLNYNNLLTILTSHNMV